LSRWFTIAARTLLIVVVLAAGSSLAAERGPALAKGRKAIVVSIGQQMLWAYRGDRVVLSSYVSTGRAGFDTPLGSYAVLTKLPSQTMEGVIGGEYYNVPDVPSVMYFTNWGHALHGTYWHANFGTPMSHGCVNLPLDVAAWLYEWTPVGTPVHVVP
jgi:lipoprotein-anchoring transpeptidase ErfK/SrfK